MYLSCLPSFNRARLWGVRCSFVFVTATSVAFCRFERSGMVTAWYHFHPWIVVGEGVLRNESGLRVTVTPSMTALI